MLSCSHHSPIMLQNMKIYLSKLECDCGILLSNAIYETLESIRSVLYIYMTYIYCLVCVNYL